MLITINRKFQTTTTKNVLLNNAVTKIPDNNKLFSAIIFTKYLHNYKSKYISKNTDNKKFLSPITFIKYLYSHKNKRTSKNNEDNNSKSKITAILATAFIKYLA